jgi:hypothetical protein
MKSNALSGRDLLAALLVVFLWGINFVITKFALRDFTPFQLGAVRFALALFPLALFIKPPRVHWKWLVGYGLLQGVGQFGLMFTALKVGMPAALHRYCCKLRFFSQPCLVLFCCASMPAGNYRLAWCWLRWAWCALR